MQLNERIDSLLQPVIQNFSGEVGVAFRSLNDGFAYVYQDEQVFSTASTAKIFILGTVLRLCEAGEISLSDFLTLKESDKMGGSGILKELDEGLTLTVKDIVTLMIISSDNTATNMIIDLVGGEQAINQHILETGLKHSRINRKISSDIAVTKKSEFGLTTAQEMVLYLYLVWDGKVLGLEYKDVFYQIMRKQQYLDFFPRYLPLRTHPEDNNQSAVEVANKTGFTEGIRCDVGYIGINQKSYAYAVLSQHCADISFAVDNEASLLLAKIGRTFYEQVLLQKG